MSPPPADLAAGAAGSPRYLQRGVPIAVVPVWLSHSDVNLTVKRHGRWSTDAREQWEWIKNLDKPIDSVALGWQYIREPSIVNP